MRITRNRSLSASVHSGCPTFSGSAVTSFGAFFATVVFRVREAYACWCYILRNENSQRSSNNRRLNTTYEIFHHWHELARLLLRSRKLFHFLIPISSTIEVILLPSVDQHVSVLFALSEKLQMPDFRRTYVCSIAKCLCPTKITSLIQSRPLHNLQCIRSAVKESRRYPSALSHFLSLKKTAATPWLAAITMLSSHSSPRMMQSGFSKFEKHCPF